MSKTLKIISLFVIMLFLTIFIHSTEQTGEIKCPRKVKVQIEKINGSEFVIYKNFTATFKSEIIVVKSGVSGAVTNMSVAVGDEISKDFPLFVINNALADEITEAQKLNKLWEKKLWQREHWKARSPRAEQQAKDLIQKYTKELESLQTRVNDYKILSPIQGKVKSLNVTQGQSIEEGTILLEITNPVIEHGTISISGQDSELFSSLSEIPVKINGTETNLKAQIKNVANDKIGLLIEDQNNQIVNAFSMEFSLVEKKLQEVVVLPKNKILNDDNGSYLFTVNGKYAKKSYLKLGPEAGDLVLVKFGLKVNEEIITTEIRCLEEGKRIRVMVLNEEGKLVKRKPGKTLKPVKKVSKKKTQKMVTPVKKEKVKKFPKEYKNYFKLGATAGLTMFFDENFKNTYGGSTMGTLLNVSYVFNNNYELFLNVGFLGKTGEIAIVEEEAKITMIPTYIGFKYLFDSSTIKPFIGLSAVIFSVKEDHIFVEDPALETGYGFAILTGGYLELSPKFDLVADLRFEIGSKEIENFGTNDSVSRNKFKIYLGFNYKF